MKLISNSVKIEMLRRMLRIRQYEELARELLHDGHISGGTHTSIGEEAAIVGACMALRKTDYIVGTHRSHGHPIAKGADIKKMAAEICGKATGMNGGKGGSMHMADFSVGSLGENSIVGAGLPTATGAALGSLMQNHLDPAVCVCFFGDGAASEATFHECLNLASIWKLPVIFFCENNGYAVQNPVDETIATRDIATRAEYYNMPGIVVDGQDPLATYEAVEAAVKRARHKDGPTLIEAKTMRFRPHAETGMSKADKARGGPQGWIAPEVEYFLKYRDPIKLFKDKLLEEGIATEERIKAIEDEVTEEIAEAKKFALESPYPDSKEAYEGVYA